MADGYSDIGQRILTHSPGAASVDRGYQKSQTDNQTRFAAGSTISRLPLCQRSDSQHRSLAAKKMSGEPSRLTNPESPEYSAGSDPEPTTTTPAPPKLQ